MSIVTHGRYSTVARGSIAEHQENLDLEEREQKLDILPEATMLRALAANYIEKYEDFFQAVLRFNEMEGDEAKEEKRKPMFLRVPSIHEAASILKDAAEIVDKVHRQQAANAIPMAVFFRLMALMADVVNKHVKGLEKKFRLTPEQLQVLDATLGAINEDWQALKVAKL
jgi:hypothetical protein